MSAFTPTREQAAIIDAPADADVLVVAGAGSGKTFTMTRRIIALIERGVPPERILGLTFTRKAAGELLERVSAAVYASTADMPTADALNSDTLTLDGASRASQSGREGAPAAAVASAAATVSGISTTTDHDAAGTVPGDRAFLKPAVFTYDAFFQSIVRQYGLLVGFDQNTQPLSEAGALQLATEVIDEHMDLVFGQDFGAFGTLASQVLKLSAAIGSAMIGSGCTSFEDAVERVRRWDTAFIACLEQALEGETMPEDEPRIAKINRAKKDTDATWQAKLDERNRQLHSRCVYHCGELLAVTRKRDILLQLVEAYSQAKHDRNMAEFPDFTLAAYQLIERFPSIGERMRRRYSHVLLDEYQDTSTTQAALLAALFHTDTDGADTDAEDAAPDGLRVETVRPDDVRSDGSRDGSRNGAVRTIDRSAVNAVGDPFQSIYAWRGASPGAFRMFQQDFRMPSGSKPFPLTVTRRNSRIVLEAANDLTLPLRSRPERVSSSLMHEVDVSPLDAMPDAAEGTLGVLGFDTGGQEIDAVTRFCKAAISRFRKPSDDPWNPGLVDANGRPAEQKAPVAVLFRSKTRMPEYQAALEQAGLTTFVVGYSALLERPEIRDLLALLHVAADHTDSASLMRLLATPRFAMSAADLADLAHVAETCNTERRFKALVQAGLADPEAPRGEWAAIVREYRDQVANAVFLPDVLLRSDLDALTEGLSPDGRNALQRAADALRRVHRMIGHPLADVVRSAVEALDLDIDTVVAGALRNRRHKADPTLAHMPTDAIVDLVDTYSQEIAVDQMPTLQGFMSWVDHLASVEDEAAAMPDGPVDVELMTVHQSKGLEWDAVAVVGLTAGGFPSNQGDHLKIVLDERHPGGTEQGEWRAPEYHETADSWLVNPVAVPVPMRADAGILPRFPHDAEVGADPIEALRSLDDVELIDDEAFGSMREYGDGVDEVDPAGWYLTQSEEYGRRLHADERRLMYVALTRAKKDVLLTYCRHAGEPGRDPSLVAKGSRASSPSNFWLEVHDALHGHAGVVEAKDAVGAKTAHGQRDVHGLPGAGAPEGTPLMSDTVVPVDTIAPPEGYFVGEHAEQYGEMVVGEAWRTPIEHASRETSLPWPASLSPQIADRLSRGVEEIRTRSSSSERSGHMHGTLMQDVSAHEVSRHDASLDSVSADGDSPQDVSMTVTPPHDDLPHSGSPRSDSPRSDSSHGICPDGDLPRDARETPDEHPGPLLERARLLVNDADLMAGTLEGNELDAAVKAKAQRILAAGRQNVTGLQARMGGMGEREERAYWRGIVRPIPRVSSPAAELGTQFHAWAEWFLNERRPDHEALSYDGQYADLDDGLAGGPSEAPETADVAQLRLWSQRLETSRWAGRLPVWTERSIVVNVPGIGLVNGKLDAVFAGGLRPDDAGKRYTVVDWKTGRRPSDPKDTARKLAQLDMYRLLLAAVEGIPLDSIDATLYYVSESDEDRRELHARGKTEQEILTELSSGIPEQSDND